MVGGGDSWAPLDTAERYDPATGQWRSAGTLHAGRVGHTTTLLPDGRVLVFGGTNDPYPSAAELYDPANNQWTAVGDIHEVRSGHTATLLADGSIVFIGGQGANQYVSLAAVERYDVAQQQVHEVCSDEHCAGRSHRYASFHWERLSSLAVVSRICQRTLRNCTILR